MNNDKALREHVLILLKGGLSYSPFDEIVADFPEEHMNNPYPNGTYSAWGLLEHIRLTQVDILNFMADPNYKEPHWPDDYWPKRGSKGTKKDWGKTLAQFRRDLLALQRMVTDPKIDLFA